MQKSLWNGSHRKKKLWKNTVLSTTPFIPLPQHLTWHRHTGVTHLRCDTPVSVPAASPHTESGELIFITTAGQVPHKYYTKKNKLTFVQRPLYLYSFREWNERQMFHCNISILSTTANTSQDKIRLFYQLLRRHQIIFNRFMKSGAIYILPFSPLNSLQPYQLSAQIKITSLFLLGRTHGPCEIWLSTSRWEVFPWPPFH